MKMLTATRVAALAVGLSLAGAQAFGADQPNDKEKGNNNSASHQQGPKGQTNHQQGPKQQNTRATGRQPTMPNQNTGRQGANSQQNRNAPNVRQTTFTARPGTDVQQNRNRMNPNNNQPTRNNLVNGVPANGSINRNGQRANDHGSVNTASFNRNFNAPRRYQAGSYNAPRGYSYRRYGYGERLPGEYYARNFWLSDFLTFGLLAPPDGYTWVRYGPDALLIDEETGEIIQVEYNVFYS